MSGIHKEDIEKLEIRIADLEQIIKNPPRFKKGDHVFNLYPTGKVGVGFVNSIDIEARQHIYWVVDEKGEHIDNWGENDMGLVSEIKLCRGE